MFDRGSGDRVFSDATTGFTSLEAGPGKQLRLHYRRVYLAACSLRRDRQGCWRSIRTATGLRGAPPDCRASYDAAKADDDPSVIEYDVEAVLTGGWQMGKLVPTGPATICRAAI